MLPASYASDTLHYVMNGQSEAAYDPMPCQCPRCQSPEATVMHYDRAEGAINAYTRTDCPKCGYHQDTGAEEGGSYPETEYEMRECPSCQEGGAVFSRSIEFVHPMEVVLDTRLDDSVRYAQMTREVVYCDCGYETESNFPH